MTSTQTAALHVAPLSAIDLPAGPFITAAHDAGFAGVGLRLEPVSPTDPVFPRDTGSLAFREVTQALADTGLTVLDIEVLSMRPDTTREQWLPLLELGSLLGASYLNVVGDHQSLEDFADLVTALTADAHNYGILPILEPVAFRPLNSFDDAVRIARQAGCAVELDVLHFVRTGASLATVVDNPGLFPVVQLCDAPATLNGHGLALRELAASDAPLDLMIAEARTRRLLPGHGAAPIAELLALVAGATTISVETPNTHLRGEQSAAEYLRMLHASASDYLAQLPR